jgi:DNA-binding transcriptional regulator YhcF (GntR family)
VSHQQAGRTGQAGDARFGELAIDRDAEVPIGVQLAWALRSRISDGELAPGQRLPGLRELAEAAGMNVNTVRAVYQRLEQQGLIYSQQGTGTFVAAAPGSQSAAVGAIAASAALQARETGVDPREVAAALYASPAPSAGTGDEAAQRRRLLRTQISALERTLGEMETAYPDVAAAAGAAAGAAMAGALGDGVLRQGAAVRGAPAAGVGPALLSAEQLEQVRAHLVRRLARVQAAIDAHEAGTGRGSAAGRARGSARKRASQNAPNERGQAAPAKASVQRGYTQPRPSGGANPAPAGA